MAPLDMDGHKLMFHPGRVTAWLAGDNIAPLYLEVGPAGICSHRCIFCAFDYSGYKGGTLEASVIQEALSDAAGRGLKAVMFAGEGEPTLHPQIISLVAHARSAGLDVSMTTNGSLFTSEMASAILPHLSWIRFSLDAASSATYERIHEAGPKAFGRVVANIQEAVAVKLRHHYSCTIGVQAVLIPDNQHEIVSAAALAKECQVDYFAVKPFSKHPFSLCNFEGDYTKMARLARRLKRLSGDGFEVIFRAHAMEKTKRTYGHCLALPFVTYIACTGEVYACSAFLGNPAFAYGNLHEESFSAIWEGKRRRQVVQQVAEMGVGPCREICRLDEMNRYLWALSVAPPPHVNFI